jgi:predicted nucleic acid-binding Zn ribbon protein
MKCPKCGAENPEYAHYCGSCSEKLVKDEYPRANMLSIAGIIIGFIIPLVLLLALAPEIYLYTRPETSAKRRGKKFIMVTLILFVVMMVVWALVDKFILGRPVI